jgi:hypothetical protein
MAEKLQYKLLNSEIVPPGDVWDKIAVQLDTEFVVTDISLSRKLIDIEIEPPLAAWPNIIASLDNQIPVSSTPPTRVAKIPAKRYAVAAVTIGVLLTAALFLFNGADNSDTTRQEAAVTPAIIIPKTQAEPLNNNGNKGSNQIASNQPNTRNRRSRIASPRSLSHSLSDNEQPSYTYAQHIHYTEPVAAINGSEQITVQAPLIRDENGNIMMDPELISYDDNYIIVTGPNGDRTRISKKFLKMVPYMNDVLPEGHLNGDGAVWKSRFEEWKKRLQNAAFVPAANNYLDIFELKEMIQD